MLERAAPSFELDSGEALVIGVGRGDLAIGQVMKALYPDVPEDELRAPKPTAFGRVLDRIRLGRGIKIQGVDGLMVRYAQGCQPVPGEPVVGYVSQGRGISIHRADCPNLLTLTSTDRWVEIDWQEVEGESFMVRLVLSATDRRGLYADVMIAVSGTGTNIRRADLHAKDGTAFGNIYVEVDNLSHLAKVLKAVKRAGVHNIERRKRCNWPDHGQPLILKTEPDSWATRTLRSDGTGWGGHVALKHIRAMRTGDRLLIYHTGKGSRSGGLAVRSLSRPEVRRPEAGVTDRRSRWLTRSRQHHRRSALYDHLRGSEVLGGAAQRCSVGPAPPAVRPVAAPVGLQSVRACPPCQAPQPEVPLSRR